VTVFPEAADEAADVDALVEQVLGGRPRPLVWRQMDARAAAAAWVELDDWVRWLARRYSLDHRDVPPCWFAHGHLVEELSALRTAHRASFDPAASAMAPVEWHQVLAAARTRLQLWSSRTGCRQGEHRPDAPPSWAVDPPALSYANDFATHVGEDLDARDA
jgi:hypothetical protein